MDQLARDSKSNTAAVTRPRHTRQATICFQGDLIVTDVQVRDDLLKLRFSNGVVKNACGKTTKITGRAEKPELKKASQSFQRILQSR